MISTDVSVEEFVEMASFLYGASWRTELSEKLGIRRKLLVLTLGGGGPIPSELSDLLFDLFKEKLVDTDCKIVSVSQRVEFLLGKSRTPALARRVSRLLAS